MPTVEVQAKPKYSRETAQAIESLKQFHSKISDNNPVMDEDKRKKQLAYLTADIQLLEQNQQADAEQIINSLKRNRSSWKLAHSDYCREIILPIQEMLKQLPRIVEPIIIPEEGELMAPTPPAVTTHTPTPPSPVEQILPILQPALSPQRFFCPTPFNSPEVAAIPDEQSPDEQSIVASNELVHKKEEMIVQLSKYIASRELEWDYHYNFLSLVAAAYYLSDTLLGTDYLNSKSRDTKISAANKCMQLLSGDSGVQLNQSEQHALADSRLGKITNGYQDLGGRSTKSEIQVVDDAVPLI